MKLALLAVPLMSIYVIALWRETQSQSQLFHWRNSRLAIPRHAVKASNGWMKRSRSLDAEIHYLASPPRRFVSHLNAHGKFTRRKVSLDDYKTLFSQVIFHIFHRLLMREFHAREPFVNVTFVSGLKGAENEEEVKKSRGDFLFKGATSAQNAANPKNVAQNSSVDLQLPWRRWIFRGLLSTRRWLSSCLSSSDSARLRKTWDNSLGVIMHLKNAAAFKHPARRREKPFMIHEERFVLKSRGECSARWSEMARPDGEGNEKLIRNH